MTIATYDTPDIAFDVAVSGDLAFVADNGTGLLVIDITNPAGPTLVGACDTPADAYSVATSGDLAIVGDDDGITVIDITNPTNPTILGAGAPRGLRPRS